MVPRGQSCCPSTVLDAEGKNFKNETIKGDVCLMYMLILNRVI